MAWHEKPKECFSSSASMSSLLLFWFCVGWGIGTGRGRYSEALVLCLARLGDGLLFEDAVASEDNVKAA